MNTIRTIQPCQPDKNPGEYDVMQPVPYPYHIDADGCVLQQDFWRGEPASLIGFQKNRDRQTVDLFFHDWTDQDVTGMHPVFVDADGSMWTDLRKVNAS